jgi:hypothetical protein
MKEKRESLSKENNLREEIKKIGNFRTEKCKNKKLSGEVH